MKKSLYLDSKGFFAAMLVYYSYSSVCSPSVPIQIRVHLLFWVVLLGLVTSEGATGLSITG